MKGKIYSIIKSDESWGKIDFIEHQRGAYELPINSNIYDPLKYYDELKANGNLKESILPKKVFLAADFLVIPKVDYPVNSLLLNIQSKKMFSIFTDLDHNLQYFSTPVVMLDHTELEAYHIEEGVNFTDVKKRNEDYIAIHLLDKIDAFDYENSKYRMKRSFPDKVGSIRKMVLKTPLNGFPPVFKIKEKATSTFVTEEAKNALEAANIQGCIFEEVEVSS